MITWCTKIYVYNFAYLFVKNVHDLFDDVVVAVGSGGTACGLAIANYLTGSRLK